jgi:nicotinate-nucleotide pyrophosphorylase (carboxylating)
MGLLVTDGSLDAAINDLLDHALAEDLGIEGDVTSTAIFSANDRADAVIKSKASGVLSGAGILRPLFAKLDASLSCAVLLQDGGALNPGTEICRLSGNVRAILAGERIALNLLQRLSGVATLTARYAAAIGHTGAKLLDTRKTTPGLRLLEKQAVRHGGGANHRIGLFDMMLIKDTHVARAGGVTNALAKAFAFRKNRSALKIEIEVQTPQQFSEALALGPDRIMLDNMDIETMRRCVREARSGRIPVEIEASGSITLASIASIAETGVDFISCGAITHSAPALDIHLIIR